MEAKQLLKLAGIRSTALRLRILELLKERHLLSADEIVDILNNDQKTCDRVTVYRNLETLQQEGLLCVHHFGDRQAKYEIKNYHAHIICKICQKVESLEDFEIILPKGINDHEIDHFHLEFYGYCKSCLQVKPKYKTSADE